MPKSLLAYLACVSLLAISSLVYYPKWNKVRTEATISWDVSGYYFYLPAIFIYHDLKDLAWQDAISLRYDPGPNYQAFVHESGNKVMKYSSGLAIQYLPFFLIAHWIAPLTDYPADGFSVPYQLAIALGSLLVACLGLWVLRIVLRRYFTDGIVALVLVTIVFATNYLDYAGINSAMTHSYLFTAYALLIFLADNYWKKPTAKMALCIGLVVGLMTLTRPTEILAVLLPILWGVTGERAMNLRMQFFRQEWRQLIAALGAVIIVLLIQVIYWKYTSGDWIVYSYEEQGFSWLSPHILNGLFSYRAGWLIYTPVMVFALIGFYFLYRRHPALFYPAIVFSVCFMYVTWAWDIWWYGGSLGQRAMVQAYAALAFPLAACIAWMAKSKFRRILGVMLLLLCSYYNLWLTHQAHRGGLLRAGEMNKAYFWKILGQYHVEDEAQFLLDNQNVYSGKAPGTVLLHEDFEDTEPLSECPITPVGGHGAVCVGPEQLSSGLTRFSIPQNTRWLRAEAIFQGEQKEWDTWSMTRFALHLMQDSLSVRTNAIRVHRVLGHNASLRCAIDMEIPRKLHFKLGAVELLNDGSPHWLLMDDLVVTAYQ